MIALGSLGSLGSACSSGVKLSGTIQGSSFTINSTAAAAASGEVSFILSSVDDICTELQGAYGEPDSQNLAAQLKNTDTNGNALPIGGGSYVVGATVGLGVSVHFSSYGDNCAAPGEADASGGSVSVSEIDPTTGILAGTLDLDFGSDHLGGAFTTANCAKLNVIKCIVVPST